VDGTTLYMQIDEDETYLAKEGEKYYRYGKDEDTGEWIKTETTADEEKLNFAVINDEYFNQENGYYVAKADKLSNLVGFYPLSAEDTQNATVNYFKIKLTEDKITEITFKMTDNGNTDTNTNSMVMTLTFSDYGITELTLPAEFSLYRLSEVLDTLKEDPANVKFDFSMIHWK
jgi:hypothetical protein